MKTIKLTLLTASLLACTASFANAADLGGRSLKDEPVYVLPANWNGLYIGANGGYSWNKSEWYWPAGDARVSPDFDGAVFGGQIGYNHQMGNLVLGIEASISGSNASGDTFCPNDDYRCRTEMNWLLLVGPRLGYAFDRTMIYATGGYARVELNTNTVPPATDYDVDSDHNGWAIGGGVEYLITPNLVLGAEYVRVLLSTEHIANAANNAERHDVDADLNIVRARLSYKLDRREEALK